MAQLLIFDLDGTLFHTAPGLLTAVNRLFARRGLPPIPMEKLVTYIGGGIMSMIEDLERDTLGKLGDLQAVESEFLTIYDETYLEGSEPYEGLLDFLNSWTGKIAILSNKKEKYVKSLVENTVLNQYQWVACYGGDSFPTKKPDPQGLENIISLAKISREHALLIGDGLPDMLVAKNAGIKSLAVSFGYAPIELLNEVGHHGQLNHFNDLSTTIEKLFSI
ncbi:MAG: HAD-IA family hydrolase [Bdellovibrionales bacterium]|nr:HAD-IA family hydrolase [Bdellovibrionales bacterium]